MLLKKEKTYVIIARMIFIRTLKERTILMKKTICKVEYNTESAELVLKKAVGLFGEPTGYEESLYKKEDGKYFLYVNGGEASPYPKEDIKRISAEKAKEWLEK